MIQTARHALAYAALRVGLAVVGAFPLAVAVGIGERVLGFLSRFDSSRRRMAERHARRLGVDEADIADHVRRVFEGYGRYWAEAFWMRPRRKHLVARTTTAEGLEYVEEARDAGSGIIFTVPHLGNWEYAAPIGTLLDIEVVAVAENLANPFIRRWFVDFRNAMDIVVVLATGSAQVMREIEAAISRNSAVALLSDRDLRGKGIEVTFFGEKTTLPAGPMSLAMRTGAPILPVAAYFDGDGHRVLVLPPLDLPTTGSRAEIMQAGTQMIADAFEVLIRRAPDQWHLLQPNWPSDRESGE